MNTRWIVMVMVLGSVMTLCATVSAGEHTFECAGITFETPDEWEVKAKGSHIMIKDPERTFHFLIMCVEGQENMGKAVDVFKEVYVGEALSFEVTNKDRTKYETKGRIRYSITEQKAVYQAGEGEEAVTFKAAIKSVFMVPDPGHIVYITDYRLAGKTPKGHEARVKAFLDSFERTGAKGAK